MAERKIEEPPANLSLKLERVFDAPRALVFEVCSKKEHIDQWMCPNGFTIPSSSGDFRVGGKWTSRMIAPSGEPYPMEGVYEKIVTNELIVTSHAWIGDDGQPEHWTTLTLRFEDAGEGKTRLTLEQSNLKSVESRDGHIGGWTECLDKLGPLLAKLQTKGVIMTTTIDTEGNTADREIVISRVFDAPRELVWEAMANPEHVVNWWGPVGFTTTIEKMDLRPGGVWKHVMHGPDGTEYPNQSTFTEVVKPERIVYVHGGARKGGPAAHFVATWSFDVVNERQTRLTLRQVYESAEARDLIVKEYGAIEGGKQTLARLAEFLA